MALQMLRSTPSFTVTLRGYDKDEVDDYIESLRDQHGDEIEALEAADNTIRALETDVAAHAERVAKLESCIRDESPRTISALGERLSLILEQAEAAAAETVSIAQQEADATREEATLAADQATQYANYQVSEAEARAAATTRDADDRARQVEDDARNQAAEILDEAERQAEARIAEINHWVGRVRTQIKAEQAKAAQEFATVRAGREAELRDVAGRRDELLASLNAVCESVTETVGAHRGAGHPALADPAPRPHQAPSLPPFDDEASLDEPSLDEASLDEASPDEHPADDDDFAHGSTALGTGHVDEDTAHEAPTEPVTIVSTDHGDRLDGNLFDDDLFEDDHPEYERPEGDGATDTTPGVGHVGVRNLGTDGPVTAEVPAGGKS